MKFEAKSVELPLELVGLDGEERTYSAGRRVTASYAEEVINKMNAYIDEQEAIKKVTDKDRDYLGILKFLVWIYPEIDTTWVKENFTVADLQAMRTYILEGLNGVKKDVES